MNKEQVTAKELADVLLEYGKKKHGTDLGYCFAFGSLQGILDSVRWSNRPVQDIINDRYYGTMKDLEELQ